MWSGHIHRKARHVALVLCVLVAVLGTASVGNSSSPSPEGLAGQKGADDSVTNVGDSGASSWLGGLWASMVSSLQGFRNIASVHKPAKPLVYKLGNPQGRYAKGLAKLVRLKSWNGKNTDHPLVIGRGALARLSDPGIIAAVRGILASGHAVAVEEAGQSEVDWVSAVKNRPAILTLPDGLRLDFFAVHGGKSLSIETEGASDRVRIPVTDQLSALQRNLASMLADSSASSLQVQTARGTLPVPSGSLSHPTWFGLLAQHFLSPDTAVAQSGTVDLLELALPAGGFLYQYAQQYNVLLQYGGGGISGSPVSCTNFYEVSYLVYPIHAASNFDYFVVVSNGTSQPTACADAFADSTRSDRVTGYYQKAWVYAAAVPDFVNDSTNLVVDQGLVVPPSTQVDDTYSKGVTWNVGGTGTVGYQAGYGANASVAFTAGVSYSTTNTYDLPAVSIVDDSLSTKQDIGGGPVGTGANIVQWIYNFQGPTVSSDNCCTFGNVTGPVSPSSTSLSSLPMFWVWRTSATVRSFYGGASLPLRSVLAPSVEVVWLGDGPDSLYEASNGDINGCAVNTNCDCGYFAYEFPCAKWNTGGCQGTIPTDVHSDITFNIPFAPTS